MQHYNRWRKCPVVELIQLDPSALAENEELANAVSEINDKIAKYDFPTIVLMDVQFRLNDYPDVNYALQQLRYLQNLISSGHVRRKEST